MGADAPVFIRLTQWRDALQRPADRDSRTADLADLLV